MEDGEQIAFKQAPKRQKLDTSGVGRVRFPKRVPSRMQRQGFGLRQYFRFWPIVLAGGR